MALSLGQLASAEGLRVLAGSVGLDRVIGWVHPTELVDPTAFLDGGELLLTTGLAFEPAAGDSPVASVSHESYVSYVDRLVAAGVAGIGFGSGVIHDRVPPGLVAAAEAAGLPLLEVPHEVPFIAITKAVSAAVAADEYATVVRTGRGQQELTRAAVGRGGPAAVVRRLARLVEGWVLLLDSGTPVEAFPASARTHAASLEVADLRGTRGFRLPSGDEVVLHSLDSRTVLAVGRGVALDAADQFIVNTAASLLSLALQRNREQSGVLGQLRSGLLDLLLAEEALAVATIRRLWPAMPEPPWRIAVVVGAAAGRRAFAEALGEAFVVVREAAVVVVAPDVDVVEPLVRRLGLHAGISGPHAGISGPHAVSSLHAGTAGSHAGFSGSHVGISDPHAVISGPHAVASGPHAGVSGPHAGVSGPHAGIAGPRSGASGPQTGGSGPHAGASDPLAAAIAFRQASQAARSARAQRVAWLDFAEYAGSGLLSLLSSESAALFAEHVLSSLSTDLIEALRCWLEEHGHYDAAATRLGIHRHTLRNRLRKVESLTGRSLSSPGTRAEFWVALALTDQPASPA
ncbi:PucR family transcriptional regulator ligand-binding domain-containing protein [Amycolatopsis lurida]